MWLPGSFMVFCFLHFRVTDVFPIRELNFSCTDPAISFSDGEPTYSDFAYDAYVPFDVICPLAFCIPPFIVSTFSIIHTWMIISEVLVYLSYNFQIGRKCALSQNFTLLLRQVNLHVLIVYTSLLYRPHSKEIYVIHLVVSVCPFVCQSLSIIEGYLQSALRSSRPCLVFRHFV